jgi:small basic protein
MAISRKSGPGAAAGPRKGGEGVSGDERERGPKEELALPEYPIDWGAIIQLMVYRLGATLAPRALQTLSRGLRIITYGPARESAFLFSFFVAAVLIFVLLVVGATLGYHLGLPIDTAVVIIGSFVSAVISNGAAVRMGRLTTPALEYSLALFADAEQEYRAINEYADQLRASGMSATRVEARIGPKRKRAFEALMSGLREVRALKPAGTADPPKAIGGGAPGAGAREIGEGASEPAADAGEGDAAQK